MWTLAHITFGYLCGRFADKKYRLDQSLWIAVLLGAYIPDIDTSFFILIGFGHLNLHGGPTHTGIGAIILGLMVGFLLWGIEALYFRNKEQDKLTIQSYGTPNRLLLFFLIASLGTLSHLILDIFNTSNVYARYHHLYLWPFSDYSFHLDLMLAGMPTDRIDAWGFRIFVRWTMVAMNTFLISYLWISHFRSDKHMWDFFYLNENITENGKQLESSSFLEDVRLKMTEKRKLLDFIFLIAISIGFIYTIIDKHIIYIIELAAM